MPEEPNFLSKDLNEGFWITGRIIGFCKLDKKTFFFLKLHTAALGGPSWMNKLLIVTIKYTSMAIMWKNSTMSEIICIYYTFEHTFFKDDR